MAKIESKIVGKDKRALKGMSVKLASLAGMLQDKAESAEGEGEEGPGSKTRERGKQVVLYLDPDEWRELEYITQITGDSKNAVYREAMKGYRKLFAKRMTRAAQKELSQ